MDNFQNQRVVITGAAGVIGTWISRAFAREGASLLLTDRRAKDLEGLAEELRQEGSQVNIVPADLGDDQGVAVLLAAIHQLWGTPDVLVNNAGIYPHGEIFETDVSAVRSIFQINVMAPFALTQGVAKMMIAEGVRGSIVNIGSGASERTATGGGPYSASKAALHMFTRAFAIELAPFGIRINTVAPGFAPGSQVSYLDDAYVTRMIETIPLGRTSGPGDAPEAVLFLCSSKASFITGTNLAVDGGRTAGTMRPVPAQGPAGI